MLCMCCINDDFSYAFPGCYWLPDGKVMEKHKREKEESEEADKAKEEERKKELDDAKKSFIVTSAVTECPWGLVYFISFCVCLINPAVLSSSQV